MSAISVHAAFAAAAQSAPPGRPEAAHDPGFSTLLSEMSNPKAASAAPDAPTKDKPAPEDAEASAPDASTLSALQSLQAALNGLTGLTPTSAAPRSGGGATASATAQPAVAASASTALAAVAGAFDGGAWDVSGKTPLKAQLQSDPALGLQDFQVKTFLAAAGATAAKAGGTALGADSAWSPHAVARMSEATASATAALGPTVAASAGPAQLAAAALASAVTATPIAAAGSDVGASHARRAAAAPRAASDKPSQSAAPAPFAGRASVTAAAASSPTTDARGRRDAGAATTPSPAATAVATAAAAPANSTPTPVVTVPLANLPAFIADQANTLSNAGAPVAQSATTASSETPKAAQAVKELKIALEPADLGQMTLKLRLVGGKLSVTIAVANPQTLSSIEEDRALIAARLGAGDQSLEDLIIQRQAPSTPETASPHGFSNDSGAEPSTTNGGANSSNPGDRKPGAPPRGGARAGGAFSDLIV